MLGGVWFVVFGVVRGSCCVVVVSVCVVVLRVAGAACVMFRCVCCLLCVLMCLWCLCCWCGVACGTLCLCTCVVLFGSGGVFGVLVLCCGS